MATFSCPIDLLPFSHDDELVAAPCGHVFHRPCAVQSLDQRSLCAVCRAPCGHSQLLRLYISISDEQRQAIAEMRRLEDELARRVRDAGEPWQLDMTEQILCEERDHFDRQLKGLQSQLQREQTEREEKVRALQLKESQLRRVCVCLTNAEQQVSAKERQFQGAEAMISRFSQSLNRTEQDAAAGRAQLREAMKKAKDLEAQLREAGKKTKELEAQLREAGKKTKELEAQLRAARKDAEKEQKTAEKLVAARREAEEKAAGYKKQLKEQNATRQDKKVQREHLEALERLQVATGELAAAREEVGRLNQRLEDADLREAALTAELRRAKVDSDARQAQESTNRRLIEQLEWQIEHYRRLAELSMAATTDGGNVPERRPAAGPAAAQADLIDLEPPTLMPTPKPRTRLSVALPKNFHSDLELG